MLQGLLVHRRPLLGGLPVEVLLALLAESVPPGTSSHHALTPCLVLEEMPAVAQMAAAFWIRLLAPPLICVPITHAPGMAGLALGDDVLGHETRAEWRIALNAPGRAPGPGEAVLGGDVADRDPGKQVEEGLLQLQRLEVVGCLGTLELSCHAINSQRLGG